MDLSSLLLPLLVFSAEVCVVTFGTLRIIFIARGQKIVAPILGFFEVFIWLLAMCQIMQNLNDWSCFFAFALGFTLGSYLGVLIEQKLALGAVLVRIITHRHSGKLIGALRDAGFGVTAIEGQGASGNVQVIMTIAKRKQLPDVVALIETNHAGAFYAVEELQSTSEGIFPGAKVPSGIVPAPLVQMFRLLLPERVRGAEKLCSKSLTEAQG